jgi:hypothetical protein
MGGLEAGGEQGLRHPDGLGGYVGCTEGPSRTIRGRSGG